MPWQASAVPLVQLLLELLLLRYDSYQLSVIRWLSDCPGPGCVPDRSDRLFVVLRRRARRAASRL